MYTHATIILGNQPRTYKVGVEGVISITDTAAGAVFIKIVNAKTASNIVYRNVPICLEKISGK